MNLSPFFKSVLEQDLAPVVLCNLEHTIIYMNPAAAKAYKKDGGYELLGSNLLNCHPPYANELILKVVDYFRADVNHNIIFTVKSEESHKDIYMVALRDEDGTLIGYYEKHESREDETMKPYDFR